MIYHGRIRNKNHLNESIFLDILDLPPQPRIPVESEGLVLDARA